MIDVQKGSCEGNTLGVALEFKVSSMSAYKIVFSIEKEGIFY